jgi:hypothetical protein
VEFLSVSPIRLAEKKDVMSCIIYSFRTSCGLLLRLFIDYKLVLKIKLVLTFSLYGINHTIKKVQNYEHLKRPL